MKNVLRMLPHRSLLPPVLGFADGILTGLTLAAGELTKSGQPISLNRALAIATSALVSGAFVFYVAHYAQLRGELVHAERQLNLLSHGRLASTRLGYAVLKEALWAAGLSSVASFLGSLIPLLTGFFLPRFRWGAIAISMTSLGILGIGLAHVVHGSYWRWCVGLVISGAVLSFIGIKLHIV
jgi:VIT1/CCC1 family predicted Fe2+/Mn2+ transporter